MINVDIAWNFLGHIGADSFNDLGNTIIDTDAENFPKYYYFQMVLH